MKRLLICIATCLLHVTASAEEACNNDEAHVEESLLLAGPASSQSVMSLTARNPNMPEDAPADKVPAKKPVGPDHVSDVAKASRAVNPDNAAIVAAKPFVPDHVSDVAKASSAVNLDNAANVDNAASSFTNAMLAGMGTGQDGAVSNVAETLAPGSVGVGGFFFIVFVLCSVAALTYTCHYCTSAGLPLGEEWEVVIPADDGKNAAFVRSSKSKENSDNILRDVKREQKLRGYEEDGWVKLVGKEEYILIREESEIGPPTTILKCITPDAPRAKQLARHPENRTASRSVSRSGSVNVPLPTSAPVLHLDPRMTRNSSQVPGREGGLRDGSGSPIRFTSGPFTQQYCPTAMYPVQHASSSRSLSPAHRTGQHVGR